MTSTHRSGRHDHMPIKNRVISFDCVRISLDHIIKYQFTWRFIKEGERSAKLDGVYGMLYSVNRRHTNCERLIDARNSYG